MSELLSADTRPTHEEEIEMSFDIIERLRAAVIQYDEPLVWESADGSASYSAEPLYFTEGDHDKPVPYGQLGSMSPDDLRYAMYNWHLVRTTFRTETREIQFENIAVLAGRVLVSTVRGPFEAEEDSTQEDFCVNSLYDDLMRSTSELVPATLRDYANFMNGVRDL